MQKIIKTKIIKLRISIICQHLFIFYMVSFKKCIMFEFPIYFNIQTEPMVTKCGSFFSQPCIHGWLELQHQNLCPICKSVVSGNRSTLFFGSVNTSTGDVRNNMPSICTADKRIEPGAYTGDKFNLAFCWTCVLMVIIILVILLCIFYFIIQ